MKQQQNKKAKKEEKEDVWYHLEFSWWSQTALRFSLYNSILASASTYIMVTAPSAKLNSC